jgi:hypothetical protein
MKCTMKTFATIILMMVLVAAAHGQNIDQSFTGFASMDSNNLVASIGDRSLKVDVKSMEGLPFNISEEDGKPAITISFEDELVKVVQLGEETTLIRFGMPPQGYLDSDQPLVYLVYHYYPDIEIGNPQREEGERRLTAVVKDAKVEVHNSGMVARTDRLRINTRSILEAESFSGREIDIIHGEKGFELFSRLKEFIVNAFDIKLDNMFDRGFSTAPVSVESFTLGENAQDILPGLYREGCSKFGFAFSSIPDADLGIVPQFTKTTGFALIEVSSIGGSLDNGLVKAADFIRKAEGNNITPVIRILGEETRTHIVDADSVASFINALDSMAEEEFIVQIWDMPNVYFDEDGAFRYPQSYADYVIEISKKVLPDVKIIAGSLAIGEDGLYEGHQMNNSMDYLTILLKIPEFWEAIDYWGSSSFGKDLEECAQGDTSIIEDEKSCLESAYAYSLEIARINEAGYYPPVFLTKVGYEDPGADIERTAILLKHISDDDDVQGAIIHSADSLESRWADGPSLEGFASDISAMMCD